MDNSSDAKRSKLAEPDVLAITRRLMKVELHAHLSGSIPDSLLATFAAEDGAATTADDLTLLSDNSTRTLSQCFRVFGLIHSLIRSKDRLRRATVAVLQSFESDGCMYLELRTTPRACDGSFSAMEYLTTVLDVIASWPGSLECRLLLSVNRAHPVAEAHETLGLIRQLDEGAHPHREYIVGLELSGNPEVGVFADFEPVFRRARHEFGSRFGLSLHFGEVDNEDEARAMLAFKPDRLGHAVCMSSDIADRVLRSGICVEVCLTSNLLTQSVKDLKEHPVVSVLANGGHPYCICTDDSAIFRYVWFADALVLAFPMVRWMRLPTVPQHPNYVPFSLATSCMLLLPFFFRLEHRSQTSSHY